LPKRRLAVGKREVSKVFIFLVFLSFLITAGCGTTKHYARFEDNIYLKHYKSIEVYPCENVANVNPGFDVTELITQNIITLLQEKGFYVVNTPGENDLALKTKLLEYKRGNAFKRWLLPGWGSTVCSVEAELFDQTTGELLGKINSRRTISFGGAYSIGAWQTILKSVAKDIVNEIEKKIKQEELPRQQ